MSGGAARSRCDVRYRGQVQGVFFRATARDLARGYAVAGWVRNEPDGSVRLVVEGDDTEVEGFLAAMRAAKRGNIESEDVERTAATGSFTRFEIRR